MKRARERRPTCRGAARFATSRHGSYDPGGPSSPPHGHPPTAVTPSPTAAGLRGDSSPLDGHPLQRSLAPLASKPRPSSASDETLRKGRVMKKSTMVAVILAGAFLPGCMAEVEGEDEFVPASEQVDGEIGLEEQGSWCDVGGGVAAVVARAPPHGARAGRNPIDRGRSRERPRSWPVSAVDIVDPTRGEAADRADARGRPRASSRRR